jgi:peptidoglycan hydrolase CwlO-like protein
MEMVRGMATELENLRAQVQSNHDVIQSAILLINGIADRVKAAQSDPGALQSLADDLASQDADLAKAIAANTPAQNAQPAQPASPAQPAPAPAQPSP